MNKLRFWFIYIALVIVTIAPTATAAPALVQTAELAVSSDLATTDVTTADLTTTTATTAAEAGSSNNSSVAYQLTAGLISSTIDGIKNVAVLFNNLQNSSDSSETNIATALANIQKDVSSALTIISVVTNVSNVTLTPAIQSQAVLPIVDAINAGIDQYAGVPSLNLSAINDSSLRNSLENLINTAKAFNVHTDELNITRRSLDSQYASSQALSWGSSIEESIVSASKAIEVSSSGSISLDAVNKLKSVISNAYEIIKTLCQNVSTWSTYVVNYVGQHVVDGLNSCIVRLNSLCEQASVTLNSSVQTALADISDLAVGISNSLASVNFNTTELNANILTLRENLLNCNASLSFQKTIDVSATTPGVAAGTSVSVSLTANAAAAAAYDAIATTYSDVLSTETTTPVQTLGTMSSLVLANNYVADPTSVTSEKLLTTLLADASYAIHDLSTADYSYTETLTLVSQTSYTFSSAASSAPVTSVLSTHHTKSDHDGTDTETNHDKTYTKTNHDKTYTKSDHDEIRTNSGYSVISAKSGHDGPHKTGKTHKAGRPRTGTGTHHVSTTALAVTESAVAYSETIANTDDYLTVTETVTMTGRPPSSNVQKRDWIKLGHSRGNVGARDFKELANGKVEWKRDDTSNNESVLVSTAQSLYQSTANTVVSILQDLQSGNTSISESSTDICSLADVASRGVSLLELRANSSTVDEKSVTSLYCFSKHMSQISGLFEALRYPCDGVSSLSSSLRTLNSTIDAQIGRANLQCSEYGASSTTNTNLITNYLAAIRIASKDDEVAAAMTVTKNGPTSTYTLAPSTTVVVSAGTTNTKTEDLGTSTILYSEVIEQPTPVTSAASTQETVSAQTIATPASITTASISTALSFAPQSSLIQAASGFSSASLVSSEQSLSVTTTSGASSTSRGTSLSVPNNSGFSTVPFAPTFTRTSPEGAAGILKKRDESAAVDNSAVVEERYTPNEVFDSIDNSYGPIVARAEDHVEILKFHDKVKANNDGSLANAISTFKSLIQRSLEEIYQAYTDPLYSVFRPDLVSEV